jgi:rod shape-determining protein MreC
LLVTDATFNVGVRLATSGDVGIAQGRGRGERLRVDLVEATTAVSVSELAVTSGLQQSTFPAGIPVGEVTSDRLPAGGIQREVRLRPTVDLSRLTVVKVLQWSPEGPR